MDDDDDARAAEARSLRRQGLSRRQIRERIGGTDRQLSDWLAGTVPPEWTKRPRAKDELRIRARMLRGQGLTYLEIARELAVSKGTLSLWLRDLPLDDRRSAADRATASRRGWEPELRRRELCREQVKSAAAAEVGQLTERELWLVGAALYWAEGSKDKPYRRSESIQFVNSDPLMISVFLAWLSMLGVSPDRLHFRLSIHETADVDEAERYWRDLVGSEVQFGKTTLKRHQPRTNRQRMSDDYRGCLTVRVRQSGELYQRVEGWWRGVARAAPALAV